MPRLPKTTAAIALTLGLFLLAASAELSAGPNIKDAPKFTKDLQTSKDPKVRASALEELGKLGQIQKSLVSEAAPDMMKALSDSNPTVRAAAAKAVGMIDPDPAEAVPALLKLVKDDKDENVKMAAIQGLGSMGPGAKEANKDLRELAGKDDKKSKLGRAAKNALKSINPKK